MSAAEILAAFEEWLEAECKRRPNEPRYRAARAGLLTARAKLRQIKAQAAR